MSYFGPMSSEASHSGHRPSRWTKAAGQGARAPSPFAWILIGVGVVVVLIGVLFIGLPIAILSVPPATQISDRLEDVNDVRLMLGALYVGPLGEETPLAPDGKLDIYGLLRREGKSTEEIVGFCHSSRTGKGPTAAEVEGGDYTHFPYERHAGPIDIDDTSQRPLIWDREPMPDGSRLVGLAGAAVRIVDAEEFRNLSGG